MSEARKSLVEDISEREIVVTRILDAPRELVWKAWTNPRHIVEWWGPHGFTMTIHEMDLRPGGTRCMARTGRTTRTKVSSWKSWNRSGSSIRSAEEKRVIQ